MVSNLRKNFLSTYCLALKTYSVFLVVRSQKVKTLSEGDLQVYKEIYIQFSWKVSYSAPENEGADINKNTR